MRSGYKAVLLDADDTIFDFGRSERTALKTAFAHYGITCTDEVARTYSALNAALWKALERGEVSKDRLRVLRFEQLADRFGFSIDPVAFTEVYSDALAGCHFLLPGAREFLQQASSRAALYLTTNGIAYVQNRRIDDAGIGGYLSGVFISELIGCPKPDPRYYDAVFAAIPHARADCIAFGDSLSSDIAGAVRAGIDSCYYNPGGAPDSDVPTYTVRTYAEFLELL